LGAREIHTGVFPFWPKKFISLNIHGRPSGYVGSHPSLFRTIAIMCHDEAVPFEERRMESASPLDLFLQALSPDKEEANRRYLEVHKRLAHFFEEIKQLHPADELVDETIDRVCRRLSKVKSENIENIEAFCFGFARNIAREARRKLQNRRTEQIDHTKPIPDPSPLPDPDLARIRCLDSCLDRLSPEKRALILEYYNDEKKARDNRKEMAAKYGITEVNLRQRVARTRNELEKCVEECLASKAKR
jgi:RNA polymerase sigma factor (sigma-70 family)